MENKSGMGIIIAAIIGLVIGFGAAMMFSGGDEEMVATNNTPTNTAMMADTNTKAADLRVLVNSLQKEHVELASAATRAGFDGRMEFNAVAASLDKNSVELSKAVGSIYGAEAEKQFLDLWRSHIGFFVDYTVAAKKGDKAGMDKAVADLGAYIDGAATFFSQANPNLPKEAVKQLVGEHVTLLKGAVDAYGAGDYTKSYDQQEMAYDQIGKIADALSGAIVKQFPAKF